MADKRRFYGQSKESLDGLSMGRRDPMEANNLICLTPALLEN